MSLLKEISEDINAYKAFLETLLEKYEQFAQEISEENRLGLVNVFEVDPYNTLDTRTQGRQPGDTVEFTPTKVPNPEAPKPQAPAQNLIPDRIHAIFDPMKGRIVDFVKTNPNERPPSNYVEANADQVANALKHLERLNPQMADMLMNGKINIWTPRGQGQAPQQSQNVRQTQVPNKLGTNKIEMDPTRLANAQTAANKMTFAK